MLSKSAKDRNRTIWQIRQSRSTTSQIANKII